MNWEKVEFRQVGEIVTGNTPPMKDPENYGGDIPWVKPPDLDSDYPVISTKETLSKIGISKARILPKDAVMVCSIGSIGKVGISGIPLATNQQINSIIFNSNVVPKFGYHYCKSILKEFKSTSTKAIVPIINKSNFEKIKISLPPLSEQKKIVEILEQADELRKKKKRVKEKSEKIITSLFYKLFGDPIKNEMRWKEDTLQNVVNLNYGDSLQSGKRKNGKYPVYGSNGIVGYHEKYLIDFPTIVIGRKGSAGSVNLVKEPSFPIDTTFYTKIKKDLNIDFLYQYLKIFDLKKLSIITGVPGVNREDIYKQKIILPPLELQNKFAERSINIKKIINDIQNSSDYLNTLFENLLYKAFKGELTELWREKNKEKLNAELKERKTIYGF